MKRRTSRSKIEGALEQAAVTFAVLRTSGWTPEWFHKECRRHERRLNLALEALDRIIEEEAS